MHAATLAAGLHQPLSCRTCLAPAVTWRGSSAAGSELCTLQRLQVSYSSRMCRPATMLALMLGRAPAQHRSLLTYISRVYYPFMVREPELGSLNGTTWAVWLSSSPHLGQRVHQRQAGPGPRPALPRGPAFGAGER